MKLKEGDLVDVHGHVEDGVLKIHGVTVTSDSTPRHINLAEGKSVWATHDLFAALKAGHHGKIVKVEFPRTMNLSGFVLVEFDGENFVRSLDPDDFTDKAPKVEVRKESEPIVAGVLVESSPGGVGGPTKIGSEQFDSEEHGYGPGV